MRFMIIVKANKDSEAGVILDASGLQASSNGWRIRYAAGKRSIDIGVGSKAKKP